MQLLSFSSVMPLSVLIMNTKIKKNMFNPKLH